MQQHIAKAKGNLYLARLVCDDRCRREIFRHIQHADRYLCARSRISFRILYTDRQKACLCVGGGVVMVDHQTFPAYHLVGLARRKITERAAVDEHRASRRPYEPSSVQLLLRLACAEKCHSPST